MPKLAINAGPPVRTAPEAPWPRATGADIEAVTRTLEEGSWCRISGDRAHRFEQEFAAFQGAQFGVAVNSGTSALELGLLALGIKPGDEVIMSPYTFMASASSVLVTRGVPVFVDIEPDTYNIDPEAIEAAITDRTFAIMPVHFGGRLDELLSGMDGVDPLRPDSRITRNSNHIYIFKYHADAFGGLPGDTFVKALSAEGIPTSKGYTRGCHQHPLFLDQQGREVWPYNRLLSDETIDYGSMSCRHTDLLCRDQTMWLSGSFMLDGGPEGMEQVAEAIDKVRVNAGELEELGEDSEPGAIA